jgi:hypothetical protein
MKLLQVLTIPLVIKNVRRIHPECVLQVSGSILSHRAGNHRSFT